MLLGRGGGGTVGVRRMSPHCDDGSPDRRESSDEDCSPKKGKKMSVCHKLKDLFVSSPPSFGERASENVRKGGAAGVRRMSPRCDDDSPDRRESSDEDYSPKKGKKLSVSHKLKDLFVSSPSSFGERASENVREGLL
ncbi:hypothetical protein ACS0TY_028077 [Phlomoides rotata]